MLVLSRKQHESICISDKIIVTMLGVHGNTVRIGIEAPLEVPVRRKEVQDKIERQEREARQERPLRSRRSIRLMEVELTR